jgi:hypothetical protein
MLASEELKQFNKEVLKCEQERECHRKYNRVYYQKNRERIRAQIRKRYHDNPTKMVEGSRRRHLRYKVACINHYSNGTMQCSRCGFTDIRALTLDHINGGGSHDRKYQKYKGSRFYLFLIQEKFPDGFQVLCMNCQFIKRHEKREFHKNTSYVTFREANPQPIT